MEGERPVGAQQAMASINKELSGLWDIPITLE